MNVLVVEDDPPLRRSVTAALTASGHAVHTAATGAEALEALAQAGFDAMILDIGLPDIDGFEILARLRRSGSVLPVVMLTARDGLRERVAGLDMGADDYVLKPFEPDELIARLRAVVRRNAGHAANLVSAGALACDLQAGSARVGERALDLRPREWAALKVLVGRIGRTVSREMLMAEVFPDDASVAPNALDVHMGRLRRKLQPDGPEIRTIRGVGYRLDV